MASLSSSSTVAVGIDLGNVHARIALFDTNLDHPVVCANHDGHRDTQVSPAITSAESLKAFWDAQLFALASSAAHTKDLHIVTSVPNDAPTEGDDSSWRLETLQSLGSSVVTEAAAICLAYRVDPTQYRTVLVLDGGASAIKATVMRQTTNGLWKQLHFAKLESVNGPALVEPLAKAVAQQFEQQHRFPRNEVWQSAKARHKLQAACEQSLGTFQRLTNVTIHIDGLYEGMDCNVTISKPKWEHLSSSLAAKVKAFCQKELQLVPDEGVDTVLMAGKLHDWMLPIVKATVGADKLHPPTGSLDPSEAVALGCTYQSYWNLQQQLQLHLQQSGKQQVAERPSTSAPTLQVPCSPVEIALTGGDASSDTTTTTLIAQGTPLPCQVTHEYSSSSASSSSSTFRVELMQTLPTRKSLAQWEAPQTTTTTTIQVHLSAQGRLRLQVNGTSIIIG